MEEPILVVMAAGMGSRYGGLKQMDPVDPYGSCILDYSVYDAVRAGFRKVLFIIRRDFETAFREHIESRYKGRVETACIFQELDNIPKGFTVPAGRTKPWGTAHAIYCCRDQIRGPFAVINADDYYGISAFQTMYSFLSQTPESGHHYGMVGYELANTVTDNGSVSRGICLVSADGYLKSITERTRIEKRDGGIAFTEDGGVTWQGMPGGTTVSMNLWGFSADILTRFERLLREFLTDKVPENPEKAEFFLPDVAQSVLRDGAAPVRVLKTPDRWYGMTYKDDRKLVEDALAGMRRAGLYPPRLWE
jgi:NDP-sugar pyrophosphorylase family protein